MADKDIVDLRIEAENLASANLIKAAQDVEGLGEKAEQAQKDLRRLEIQQETIASFDKASQRVNSLQQEVAEAATKFKDLRSQLKKTEGATDEQTNAVNRQQQEVKKLTGDLRGAEREFRTLDASLRNAGVNTKEFASEQQRLTSELSKARVEADRLNNIYDERIRRLREQTTQQRASTDAAQEESQAQARLTDELEEQNRQSRETLAAKEREEQANREVTASLVKYEQALERLNREKTEGRITTGTYIRSEERLRKELQLTATQASVSRRAIEADSVARGKSVRNTDALTQVTRRLAQAYTVLIATQGAAQAALGNVEEFGKFEQAVVNIERTTGIASDEVQKLADQIIKLGTDVTPTATSELLRFAEVAGQLGVKSTGEILQLVAAADQLGVATNIAGDEAATLLTRILQTSGEGVGKIGNLASSVVTLGNNFATTESEIVKFGKEIITATRDIGISTAAAVGLGTTLAVAGQRAEASRTAISRLSQAIRSAATTGGDDLESLASITRLTGDQIVESLGVDAEKVILGFVEGLGRAQKQGEVTLDVLRRFGIDGQEAAGVFNGLSARVETLADALNQSNDAYVAGNAQIIEASRAYATQEGAVGRLSNTFNLLRKNLGEAFSDETDTAVRRFTDSIEESEAPLIQLFELLPDVVSQLDELVGAFDNLASTFGSDSTIFTGISEGFVIFGNAITAGLNAIVLSMQTTALAAAEFKNAVTEAFGGEVDTTLVDTIREQMGRTRDDILRDSDDIVDSLNRLSGTSPRSFEDLIDAADKYETSLGNLTVAQKKQLDDILLFNEYNKESESVYNDLTAAIIKANRQVEIAETLTVKQAEAAALVAEELKKEEEAKLAVTQATAAKNAASEVELSITERLALNVANLNAEYLAGAITAKQLISEIDGVTTLYNQQSEALTRTNAAQEIQTQSVQALLAEMASLVVQQEAGAISTEAFASKQSFLQGELDRTNAALKTSAEASTQVTAEQANLAVAIDKSTRAIADFQIELRNENLGSIEKAEILARLISEQEKLNGLTLEQTRISQIDNATFAELNQQREVAIQQLDQLNRQFQSGAITTGEYQEKQALLAATISELNSILGTNTEAVKTNSDAQKAATKSTDDGAQATEKATKFTSLYAEANNYLAKEFDFANDATVDLKDRIKELEANISTNTKVTNLWWKEIANVNNQGFEREKQIIQETISLRRYISIVESGTASLAQLNGIGIAANANIRTLGDNQLEPLRRAIADAKREFQDLNESIDDALNETLNRLDEISGNQEEIVKRRYEEEKRQYEELLSLAQQSGDAATISRAQTALRNLAKAQALEFKAEFRTNNADNNTLNNTSGNTNANAATSQQVFTVNLRLPDGGSTTINVADQESVASLLETFESFGDVSSGG